MMKEEQLQVFHSYQNMHKHYLKNALKLLVKRDYRKTSEMLWGAVSQAIKASAIEKGIKIRHHKHFKKYIEELTKTREDERLINLFEDIEILHQNFYDEIIPNRKFIKYFEKVMNFLTILK